MARCAGRGSALVCAALALASGSPVRAQARWSVELAGGFALNLRTPLVIRQSGAPDIALDAQYQSRSFASPLYYALRLGRWSRGAAWEVEFVHHKLYLRNRPAEVQQFEVSHGFNLIMVNRALPLGRAILRPGLGLVLAHPESVVRGRSFAGRGLLGAGYYVAGPVAQLALARRLGVAGDLFVSAEGKVTAAYASVPVEGGRASLTNVAVHGLLGLGYGW